ncbi:MAG: short-chain dehydrogenase [Chromatiales bacterium]|jgi:short-subunit dehydrogenase|nr:short-chain dehydrogenase [Chromatiales bacterium]MDP6149868.1 SDR family NAD(P)-dependent oxidoreductase [Gammaproteobacteria bacterium]MDP7094264.1 SDR family NAD(P)-dependent oxidoreductase [Gammaproteobacteria bacterium]MDP7270587.1 SDR family NAD(P)-dependent oxidoreductase [Gammaproteobacteria bacterium]HJP04310.1 SDR family NAD(P)-dependent oxidoreductase [Gammaproteobacteria bacterium]
MANKLENQTIWITGASSGVGEGIAKVFHREGANIIISARREAELERVKADCDSGAGGVKVVPFDITDARQREAAAGQVLADNTRLDGLVNNAGIGQRALVKDTHLDVDRRVMEVDYFAPIALTKLVLPRMMEQKSGQLIVTSSVAGKHGMPFHSAYCAAKHALHGYFDTLRIELLEYNIQVMLLVIAGIRSNVAEHALLGDGSEYGQDDWGSDVGISAEECGERVVEAMLAGEYEPVISIDQAREPMELKDKDPEAFIQRMAGLMKWMKE